MKGLLTKKIAMTQVFNSKGVLIPVTVLQAEPNVVLDVKTKEKHGYDALQLGFETIDAKHITKPMQGQFTRANTQPKRHIIEIRDMIGFKTGDLISLNQVFTAGQLVDATGATRGYGFTGAIKRWNMKIGPLSHGAGYPHRYQGSLGGGRGGSSAQHVFKGKHMSGHYGNETVTVQNLQVISIDSEKNIILIKGAVPGPKGALIRLMTSIKYPNVVKQISLVDVQLESKKNAILEEARKLGIALNLDLTLVQMQKIVDEAKVAREQQSKVEDAATAAKNDNANKDANKK